MVVDLTQASGEFTLPDPRPARVLLISGGSGITPVMAHLRTLCEERFEGEIGFLNYARSPELALYGRELARIAARHPNVRVARAFTTGVCGPTGAGGPTGGARAPLTGRFCREHLAEVLSARADAATFVCGPPTLIDAVARVWAEEELRAPTVETFTAPAISLDTGAAGGVIRFERSGREVESSGLPLLEQAEDAGLLPEHGCRMGICNTCSTRKRAGVVRNVITGEISRDGEEDIRICVSAPAGDVALDL
jgi:ferredoxin-NADP reductase